MDSSPFCESYRKSRINAPASNGRRSALKLDGEDVEYAQQLPAQQKDRKQDHKHRQQFSKGQSASVRLEPPRSEAQNIKGCEPENNSPENIGNVIAAAGMALQK